MNEFIKQDGNILVNANYAEAYIPSELFREVDKESQISSAVAFKSGQAVNVIGCFNMRFMESDQVDRESVPLRTFVYPSAIETQPTTIRENVHLKLTPQDDEEDDSEDSMSYTVLCYYKGDIMMPASSAKSVANCEKFLNMMTRGKIPNTIPYSLLPEIWAINFEINDTSSGVPSVTQQCIIAEQCRSIKNPRNPFRKVIGKGGKVTEHDYIMGNMRTIASYNSTFSALTFEDMGQMLTASVNMTRTGSDQTKSPIEKALTY